MAVKKNVSEKKKTNAKVENVKTSKATPVLVKEDSDDNDENDVDEDDSEIDDEEDATEDESADGEGSDSEVSNGGSESDDDFEQQSSDDDISEDEISQDSEHEDGPDIVKSAESTMRNWNSGVGIERSNIINSEKASGSLALQQYLHNDDLSSDDEEAVGNTIGRVPLHWYDAYDHIGYDIKGAKLAKRKGQDKIDLAILQQDDPTGAKTIYDMYNDREVTLSERELEIIRRIQSGAFAHPEHDDTPDYVDYYTHEREVMPISAAPEPKRNFVPSKWEMMRVMKIVKAIKEGRYKEGDKDSFKDKGDNANKPPVFLIWNDEEDDVIAESKKHQFHLPAPKMPLPGHAESYNPPPEYLLTAEEVAQQEDLDPKDRTYNFLPTAHDCLRHVAGYDNFVKERFERCLDLYLCPRKIKRRLNIDPETLVPRLPKPKELKPFPNSLCLQFLGHTAAVRSIAVSPDGQYLASASDDGTVRLWEVDTCLCRHVWDLESGPVIYVAWNPDAYHHVLSAIAGSKVVLIATGTGDADSTEITEAQLAAVEELVHNPTRAEIVQAAVESEDEEDGESKKKRGKTTVQWHLCKGVEKKAGKKNAAASLSLKRHGAIVGPRVELQFNESVTSLAWHYKGDYLAVVAPTAGAAAISIHQLSKGKTQFPFSKSPGNVQCISFHPSRPFLFVATQQHVKVFNLVEQKMVKKLMTGCKWISSLDVHPSGDHVAVGSYDRRVVWFDMDLSSTPYRTLKFHEKAVRNVQFHKRYPLLASASDDGNVHIFHSTVYSDLMRNPLIVPLKVLKGHGVIGGAGVFSAVFHPRQPWIFTAGADSVINLFQDI